MMGRKLEYDEVKDFVEKNSNCQLLSTFYIDNKSLMDFACECGEIFTVSLGNFKSNNKRKCDKCIKRGRKNTSNIIYIVINNEKVEAKKCSCCKKIKPLEKYSLESKGFLGRKSQCKKCISDRMHKYYIDNDIKEKNTENYYINKNEIRNKRKDYYTKNKSRIIQNVKKYRENNPFLGRIQRKKRREKENLLIKKFGIKEQKILCRNFNNSCSLSGNSNELVLDHFIPVSIGHGGTYLGNIVLLTHSLNANKTNKNPFEWIKTRPEIDIDKFNKLVEYLAGLNNLNPKEYKEFVYWCFENPRTIEQIKKDGDKTSIELWKESKQYIKQAN